MAQAGPRHFFDNSATKSEDKGGPGDVDSHELSMDAIDVREERCVHVEVPIGRQAAAADRPRHENRADGVPGDERSAALGLRFPPKVERLPGQARDHPG